MNESPDEEGPWCGCHIGLAAIVVNGRGGSNSVDIRPQEEEVDDDVGDFEEDTVLPGGISHGEGGEASVGPTFVVPQVYVLHEDDLMTYCGAQSHT